MDVFKSINPFTQEKTGEFLGINADQINGEINLNRDAYVCYKEFIVNDKAALLSRLATELKNVKEKAALLMAREMGKPVKQGIAEIEKCAWLCEYYAKEVAVLSEPRVIVSDASNSFVRASPQGAVFMIMPWNYPFWQVFRVAAPSAALGNSLMLKHAPNVQGCAKLIEEIFVKSGFPKHYFKNLPIDTKHTEEVIAHPHICGVSVTGSTKAGRAVAALAGKHLKKTVLELGGSNPFIVLPDADLNDAVDKAVTGRFQNTGQSCIAAKRILVHEKIEKSFTKLLKQKVEPFQVGNPELKDTFIGPMARVDLAVELYSQYQKSIEQGATVQVPAKLTGAKFSPGVLCNVKPGMPAFDEETFGPLACITTFSTIDEAVNLANQSPYGLGVSIFCAYPEEHQHLTTQIQDGAVFFNEIVKSDPRLPFGGTKHSGYGRELSSNGYYEFANIQTVYID